MRIHRRDNAGVFASIHKRIIKFKIWIKYNVQDK